MKKKTFFLRNFGYWVFLFFRGDTTPIAFTGWVFPPIFVMFFDPKSINQLIGKSHPFFMTMVIEGMKRDVNELF